jgi:hypothetical protein
MHGPEFFEAIAPLVIEKIMKKESIEKNKIICVEFCRTLYSAMD